MVGLFFVTSLSESRIAADIFMVARLNNSPFMCFMAIIGCGAELLLSNRCTASIWFFSKIKTREGGGRIWEKKH